MTLYIIAGLAVLAAGGGFWLYRRGRSAERGDAAKENHDVEKKADAARRAVHWLDAAERDRLLNRRD